MKKLAVSCRVLRSLGVGGWLLAVSVALAASVAQAEPVEYRDYDAATGTFTNAVRECTLVTGGTRTLSTGWWAVKGEVTIPAGSRLVVQGTANLVLCDGAKLKIENPGVGQSAVKTTDATLVIYGQDAGTGALVATGGLENINDRGGAGIGGDANGAGGTVTINGGTVTATARGQYAAGLGGGYGGSGGIVTINGGTVAATGGFVGAGIGDGMDGVGGSVSVGGGSVMATGGEMAAGISGQVTIDGGTVTATSCAWGAGISGSVVIDGGTVTAKGGETAAGISGEATINGGVVTAKGGSVDDPGISGTAAISGGAIDANSMQGDIRIWGGIFVNEPQAGWVDSNYEVVENPDETTRAAYPYALKGIDITYLEWDEDQRKTTNAVVRAGHWTVVTAETRTLNDGWYVVRGEVTIPEGSRLVVQGAAHLILCDGAKLSVEKPGASQAAVKTEGATLVIYGQDAGTGALVAVAGSGDHYGYSAAGIGGDGESGSGGTVTINGGTVTAMSGAGAGIGGASYGEAGIVTINGGTVTATSRSWGAGIGGGASESGGTVTINGGVVTATGGDRGAGIGGGHQGAGGTVTINGGVVTATGGEEAAGVGSGFVGVGCEVTINGGTVTAKGGGLAAGIGNGDLGAGCTVTINGGVVTAMDYYGTGIGGDTVTIMAGAVRADDMEGDIQISGGIFNIVIPDAWCAPRFAPSVNPDPDTRVDYPYAVVPGCTVTIGDYPHLTAEWTSGEGTMVRALEGSVFKVPCGAENVSVRFTATSDYAIDGEATVCLGTVTEDIVFGVGNDYKAPRIYCLFGDIVYLDWNGSQMTNAVLSKYDYELVTDATAGMNEGWYVVARDVEHECITVTGAVNLVIVDGCELKVGGRNLQAGIDVSGGSHLTIYGQVNGTGKLTATSGECGAGIGGGYFSGGGTVTINGGTVTATSGEYGAGIGGGQYGAGGTVEINGGTVTATGGKHGAGIGGGCWGGGGTVTINGGMVTAASAGGAGIGGGAGDEAGTVTINGGTVTATSSAWGAGIGGGDYGAGGVVTINGGRITAKGSAGGEDIGHGTDSSESGTISISGGIFWDGLQDDWIEPDSVKMENPDEATKVAYPWAVVPQCVVTVGDFPRGIVEWTSGDGSVTNVIEDGAFKVKWGTENVMVFFTAKPGYELVGETTANLGTVTENIAFGPESGFLVPTVWHEPVKYIDSDGVEKEKSGDGLDVVTAETRTLTSGWYAVEDEIDITAKTNIVVQGDVHLILCDGASLTVTNAPMHYAAVSVGTNASLTIYAQAQGTGCLTAKGGAYAAGIGGGHTGDGTGAVTIHGGTVTANGGTNASGIGGCYKNDGGSVTITGGRIAAAAKSVTVGDIGNGALAKSDCSVSIYGGVFARELNDNWLAPGYMAVANEDESTKAEYQWAIAVDDRTRIVLGVPLGPYDTAVDATNAMMQSVFVPSDEVADVLTDGAARRRYDGWFGLVVTSKGTTEWYVEATLTDAAKSNLVDTAAKATRQIPVADIAALTEGTKDVPVEGCEPGFYYTLYGAAGVTPLAPRFANSASPRGIFALPETGTAYRAEPCDVEGKVVFPAVEKPSDAAGFFTIGVSATRGKLLATWLDPASTPGCTITRLDVGEKIISGAIAISPEKGEIGRLGDRLRVTLMGCKTTDGRFEDVSALPVTPEGLFVTERPEGYSFFRVRIEIVEVVK